jgi:hydrogenase maturation protein HypF
MFKDINAAEKYLKINPAGKNSLLSPAAPIVLLEKKPDARLSEHVSYNNRYEGAMLAYTPLHHLIFEFLDIPLVMTSGNISEEPIASENQEAFDRLEKICDCFLVHNRDIYSKYDDSVIKIFNGREMMLRRARGYAPYPVKLDIDTGKKVVLATGAQEKNTFCIVKKNYAIVSQHTGDLDTIKTADFFRETIGRYRDLFGIKTITAAAYDLHPDYYSSKFAMGNFKNIRKVSVQHHIAHLAGVIAENSLLSKDKIFLGFSWDGSGFGSDGKIWGGETFFIDCSLNFTRVGSLNEKVLPGGSAAVLNPYKMAGVYIYSHFKNISESHINRMALSGSKSKDSDFKNFLFKYFPHYKKIFRQNELEMLTSQIISGYNSPLTTSMGRFFDAVSSLINVTHSVSYEGEAAIDLEMIADPGEKNSYKIKIDDTVFQPGSRQSEKKPQENYFIIDDHYIFSQIIDDFIKKTGIPAISAKFHNTLAQIILDICLYFKKHYNVWSIILSGGVFQNNVLISKAFKILEKNGFKVYTNFAVPVNDGGISLGQAYIAACEIARRN